jgi:heme-degrading monooxygenase HmoA
MLKFLNGKALSGAAGRLVLTGLLVVGVWLVCPGLARADKAPVAVPFDASGAGVSVAAIYETTPTTQKDVVSSLFKSSKSFYKKALGFTGLEVLKSQDGERVVTLTQWQDAESYAASIAPPAEEDAAAEKPAKKAKKGKEEVVAIAPTKTIVFSVDKTQAPEGIVPALRGDDSLIQFSTVTAKAEGDFAKLVSSAETALAGVSKLYPAPKSVILLKGVDSSELALLADWGYAATDFADITKAPTLAALPDSAATLADSDQRLYQVVKAVAPKPKKEAKAAKEEKDEEADA